MKEYIIKVNKNKIISPDIKLVQNDYNSTKFVFDFDFIEDYKKVFQMKLPSGTTWIKEIINNELILSDENNTETVSVLVEDGLYEYDIAIYDDNSKLTTTDKAYLTVRSEIKGENVELDDRVPILGDLINETRNAVNEANNLNIDIENSVVTITKKDGTVKSENVKGDKGDKGDAGSIKFIIVNELPSENIDETAIYMKSSENPDTQNTYEEFIYVNGLWESLGTAQVEVDLTDYVKNTDFATKDKGGVVKVISSFGISVNSTGFLTIFNALNEDIDARKNTYRPITPANLDYAVGSVFPVVTQAEYDALVTAGTVNENLYYCIVEEE